MGLDTLQGFWLWLLPPLLYLHQHLRGRVREVPLSIYPLLDLDAREVSPGRAGLPRLSRRARFAVLALAITGMALAYNGLHFTRMEDRPGPWLVVHDNSSGGLVRQQGHTVHEIAVDEVRRFTTALNSRDTFTLLTTSPAPDMRPGLDREMLLSSMADSRPAHPSPEVPELARLTESLMEAIPFKGVVVVSPRGDSWRQRTAHLGPSNTLVIGGGGETLEGNAGIVSFDLSPSADGSYDLFFVIASSGLKTEGLTAEILQGGKTLFTFEPLLGSDGSARIEARDLALGRGEVTLRLRLDDLLEMDNAVRAVIAPEDRPLFVDFGEGSRPFLKQALLADRRVRSATSRPIPAPGKAVRLLDGRTPGGEESGPMLVIFPTRDFMGLGFRRIWTTPLPSSFNPVHPVTRNARFRDFRPVKIPEFDVPEGYEVIADADGIPLVIAGEGKGGRLVVWAFDPEDNGIYVDPAFPILALESARWLAGEQSVSWDRGVGCIDGGPSQQDAEMWTRRDGNLLCRDITVQAGRVTLPRLPRPEMSPTLGKVSTRYDLGRFCLMVSGLSLLILALDSAASRRTTA